MKLVVASICFLVLGLFAYDSVAESVLIKAGNSKGQGWLFGAAGNAGVECWIATPAHVIRKVSLQSSIQFRDMNQHTIQTEGPIFVENFSSAQTGLNGTDDLAFARVLAGRERGDCLSRLGPPTIAYEAVHRTDADIRILSRLSTSYGVVGVQISRAGADQFGGALMFLAPKNAVKDQQVFKAGLSGSVAMLYRGQSSVPFAMIIQVDQTQAHAKAIRFDAISHAFEVVRQSDRYQEKVKQRVNAEYDIIGISGDTINATDITQINSKMGCWKANPSEAGKPVSIVIAPSNSEGRYSGIQIGIDETCGAKQVFQIAVQPKGRKSWMTIQDCNSDPVELMGVCRLNVRPGMKIRLSALTDNPISLSYLGLVQTR